MITKNLDSTFDLSGYGVGEGLYLLTQFNLEQIYREIGKELGYDRIYTSKENRGKSINRRDNRGSSGYKKEQGVHNKGTELARMDRKYKSF